MTGKEKCKILKTIRKDIATANDIKLDIPECKHKGECMGTCPRCEAEVKMLENELATRRKRGLKIAVAGISAGLIALNTTSCDILDEIANRIGGNELQGKMLVSEQSVGQLAPPESDTTATETVALKGDIPSVEEFDDVMMPPDTELVLDGDIAEIPGEIAEDGEE